ncbi:zf-HC2 domain-containing protein [Candidatus Omnitrophota bacterium]
MKCNRVKKLLFSFMGGELSLKDREDIKSHLEVCKVCQKENEFLSQFWEALDGYTTPRLRDNFSPRLMSKIYSEQIEDQGRSNRLPGFVLPFSIGRLVPALAMVLMIIFGFITLIKLPKAEIAKVAQPKTREIATALSEAQKKLLTMNKTKEKSSFILDEEIVNNLEMFENIEFYENLDLASDFDLLEEIHEPVS